MRYINLRFTYLLTYLWVTTTTGTDCCMTISVCTVCTTEIFTINTSQLTTQQWRRRAERLRYSTTMHWLRLLLLSTNDTTASHQLLVATQQQFQTTQVLASKIWITEYHCCYILPTTTTTFDLYLSSHFFQVNPPVQVRSSISLSCCECGKITSN